MLLEDTLEPVAQQIAEFLSQTGGYAAISWENYSTTEDLTPFERVQDDEVEAENIKEIEALEAVIEEQQAKIDRPSRS